MYDTPEIFNQAEGIVAVQSKRNFENKEGKIIPFNLGLSTSDDLSLVKHNRELFFNSIGISESQVASSFQIHGTEILKTSISCRENGYDAVICDKPNVFACVTVADCVPILIADPKKKIVAAVHSGWRGTAKEILKKTLHELQRSYFCETKNLLVYIGTCITLNSFEVGEEVASQFNEDVVVRRQGKQFIDLKKANKNQLLSSGIPEANIETSSKCTFLNNEDYFSFRKEGEKSGRMLAIIGFKE